MIPKSHALKLAAVCGFFLLLCVLGIAWTITSGLLTSGIDGILMLFVCLMMAGIFGLMLLIELIKAGVLPSFGHSKSKAANPATKAVPPAPQSAPQGK